MDTIFHVEFSGLGLEFTLNRVAFSIGNFNVYWYGILIAAGLLLAMLSPSVMPRISASMPTAWWMWWPSAL